MRRFSEEALAWLQLAALPNMGPARLDRLRRAYGSGCAARNAFGPAWLDLPHFTPELIAPGLPEPAPLLAQIAALELQLIACTDPQYPPGLHDVAHPPVLLFARGDLEVWHRPMAAVIGTRRASRGGLQASASLARELAAAGVCVVSGLARGIDTAAHRGALAAPGGATLAVLAGGLDAIYPPENAPLAEAIGRRGLLLSETPPGVREERFRFPIRNRIIAGLSRAVVVVEAPPKSGALQTAGLALDLGRDVYAVPADVGRWSARGSNRLLVETQVALDGLDVLSGTFRELAAAPVAAAADSADPGGALEQGVLAALGAGPMTLEALQLSLGAERAALFEALTRLELAGKIARLGPQTYAVSTL